LRTRESSRTKQNMAEFLAGDFLCHASGIHPSYACSRNMDLCPDVPGARCHDYKASSKPEFCSRASGRGGFVNESGSRPQSQSFRELLTGLLPFLLGIDVIFWVVFIPVGLRGDADFAMFYTAGSMVRGGSASQLYDYEVETRFQQELVSKTPAPYTHLPYDAAAFAPLSLLDYRAAYWVFLGLNILFAGLAILLLGYNVNAWLFIAVLAVFFPVSAAIADGQDSIVLLMIAASTCWLLSRKEEFSAGALLALGIFRFQLMVAIAALMFIWKRWRFVAGFALSSVVMLAVSGALGGFQQLNVYAMRLLSLGGVTGSQAGYAISTSQLRRMVSLRALFANLR